MPRCLTALQVLAGAHLGVRLTRTREEALPLLAGARRRGTNVRVWPLGAMPLTDHTPTHAPLQRAYGREHVIRPSELVRSALAHAEEREQFFESRALYYESQMRAMAEQLGGALTLEFPPPPVFESGVWRREQQAKAEAEALAQAAWFEKTAGEPPTAEQYTARGNKFQLRSASRR